MQGDLGNAAGVGRHAGQAGEHRLHQRLRHAFVGVGRQHEDVERLQPGQHVALVAREAHPLAELELVDERFQRLALRAVADDHEVDAG